LVRACNREREILIMKDNKGLEEGKITLLYFVVGESYITFLLVFILFSLSILQD